jgi:hypothetical protein
MKVIFKNLLKFRNTLWILLILLILIVGYNTFCNVSIFEGVVDLNIINTVVISPLGGTSDWLNIAKITLTDVTGARMDYDAVSSNGTWSDNGTNYKGYYLTVARLYDNTDSPYSMFHSGNIGCTLTITPKDATKKLAKITIRNRRDGSQDRLKYYKMSFKNISGNDVIPPINLKDIPRLLDPTIGIEDIILPSGTTTLVSYGGTSSSSIQK